MIVRTIVSQGLLSGSTINVIPVVVGASLHSESPATIWSARRRGQFDVLRSGVRQLTASHSSTTITSSVNHRKRHGGSLKFKIMLVSIPEKEALSSRRTMG